MVAGDDYKRLLGVSVPLFVFQMTKSVTCPDELGALASQVTGDYSQLAVQGRLAAHTAEPEEVSTTSTITIWLEKINSVGEKQVVQK